MSQEPGGVDEPPPRDVRSDRTVGGFQYDGVGGTPEGDAVSRLRPYLLTSGRAEPVDHTLEIEAQVQTTEFGATAYGRLSFEYREIVELCMATMSVAEVAARLRLHIGVARVLVADLAALGYLIVQRPSFPLSQDPNLIERVIRGLEAIR
jgi:Protein of unknown function (DUF742)